ncbi:MAG TPA: hydantoinase B/oxoprolinase family protein [Baekduia sp.]|uniref:hydantoinase B/oxoprolinase family protein n=1 Tax=Baekduia sp. TaxID=2600305 RepID=UPI002D784974|nr:hydantoinase B/oxoprolinase family protein [Baekduia sp.]HET6509131.1 hydantoinase B/oxoprolinase family protein [Baekduia sp.]
MKEGATRRQTVDGVQLAILASRFQRIVRKMTNTLFRTARSGVISNARDFSCCIVTADHELLVAAESLPIHVMAGPDLISRYLAEVHPVLRRGDAFLHNSPYHGNSHAGDHCLLVPVIDDDGHHRFTAVVKAHMADVGNAEPSTIVPAVRDVYEEGALIFPAVQVQRDFRDIDDVIRMCEVRVRVPRSWRGDYNGMVGAARIAEREILALAGEVGWDALETFVDDWFDYSEHRMVEAIRAMPDGTATAQTAHDAFEGFPEVRVNATVAVDHDDPRITVDLRDNPDCLPFGLNLTEATSLTTAMVGTFMSIDASVPANAGSFRRLDVKLRDGCIVGRPVHPFSCSGATTNVADRMTNAVQMAFARLGGAVGLAEIGSVGPPSSAVVSGHDPRKGGAPYIDMMVLGMTGGAGAPAADGWLTAVHAGSNGSIMRNSTEATEHLLPIRIWVDEIIVDSEGAGKHRGAPANLVEWGPNETRVEAIWFSDGTVNPALGVCGGGAGALADQWIRQGDGSVERAAACHRVWVEPDQRVVSLSPGGGGYGDPLERDPASVAEDVREGWITVERARETYGVVIGPEGGAEPAATAARRAEAKHDRKDASR